VLTERALRREQTMLAMSLQPALGLGPAWKKQVLERGQEQTMLARCLQLGLGLEPAWKKLVLEREQTMLARCSQREQRL